MKVITLILCILMSSFGWTSSDTLTIGTLGHNPPYSTKDSVTNNLYGFDIDLMQHICKIMNKKCIFKIMSRQQLLKKINENGLDLVIGTIPITNDYLDRYIFSLPYLSSSMVFVTNRDAPFTSIKSLQNAKIGYTLGTSHRAFIQKTLGKKAHFKRFDSIFSMMVALKENQIDALVMDKHSAEYWVEEMSGACKIIDNPIPYGLGYAILINKNSSDLIPQINHAILHMENDGTFLNLYKVYIE